MSASTPSRPWFLIVALTVLLLALAALGWAAWQRNLPNAFLTITNNSGETVTEMVVLGAKETFLQSSLPSGQSASFSVNVSGRATWDIAGKWPNGAIFEQSTPVFSGPGPHNARVTLMPGRKIVSDGPVPQPQK